MVELSYSDMRSRHLKHKLLHSWPHPTAKDMEIFDSEEIRESRARKGSTQSACLKVQKFSRPNLSTT
jgi:hypothetical protein